MLQQVHSFLGTVPSDLYFSLLIPFCLMMFTINRLVDLDVSLNKRNAWLCGLAAISGMVLTVVYKPMKQGFTPGMTIGLLLTISSSFIIGGLISQYQDKKKNKP